MKNINVGFALCGSFCTIAEAIKQIEALKALGADITPILSQTAYSTSTRFGKAEDIIEKIDSITGALV